MDQVYKFYGFVLTLGLTVTYVTHCNLQRKLIEMHRWSQSVYASSVLDTFGQTVELQRYMGHVLLIVNIASRCGLTDRQYAGLARLREAYEGAGLRILNFPCNQFGQQMPEKNGNEMMEHLVKRNLQIGDIFAKIRVNGPRAHPLYRRLARNRRIEWNFTKFLIDHNGLVYKRYEPETEPNELAKDIEWLLLQRKTSVEGKK